MATGFKVAQVGDYLVDVDDILARREYFNEGNLWTWGWDDYGQLGDNSTLDRSSPGTTSGGGTNWKQVSAGRYHSLGIKTDGTLWGYGYNTNGEANPGYPSTQETSPVGGSSGWKQVSAGYGFSCGIDAAEGTLWTWGRNESGQLGDSTTTNRPNYASLDGTNWKQVASGYYHTAAIKTDGTLWTWGYNGDGELGNNSTANRSSPVTTSGGGTNWKQVASGYYHTAAIKTDGTLWTWGYNGDGELGNNSTTSRSSPVTTSGGGTNWKQVASGYVYTAAIKTDGTLWTWGWNEYGQLGNNSTINRSSPATTIGGGTNWKQVATGAYHTAAIKTDGTLWTWGNNKAIYTGTTPGGGQLGDNSTINRSSPVTTILGGTIWKQVSCGYDFTKALTDLTL